jgi:hypothetical protein
MPTLGNTDVKRLYLPSTPEGVEDRAWVDVKAALVVGDIIDAESLESDGQKGMFMISRLILDWNFTTPTGEKAPVDIEWVKKLSVTDFAFLSEYLAENVKLPEGVDDIKKKEA